MGKKKQLKKLAKSNIQILKSGKIKVSKGQKIDLKSFVNESIENTVVSRLDGIISKEEVVLETSDLRVDILTRMTGNIKTSEICSKVNTPTTNTIIVTINKKDALEVFDFLDEGTMGVILRMSTLASIYSDKSIKDAWVKLNEDDTTPFTNVMYIPKIMMFIDPVTGDIRKSPYYVNLLLVAVPSQKKMTEGIEEVSDDDACARVIADVADAAIKCGVKDAIYDPYEYKLFRKDPSVTADLWLQMTTSQRFIEQFHSFIFTFESEELFIVFNATRTK